MSTGQMPSAETTMYFVNNIIVPKGRRKVNEDRVKELAESIAEVGQLQPIVIIEDHEKEKARLVVGAHRLGAFKMLKLDRICATVSTLSKLDAELAEIDENLIRFELTAAERAKYTAKRKKLYLAKYPQTGHGKAPKPKTEEGKAEQGKEANVSSFDRDTAAKSGKSSRSVRRDATRGEKVDGKLLDDIAGTDLDTGSNLDALSKLPAKRQKEVVAHAKKKGIDNLKTAKKSLEKDESIKEIEEEPKPLPEGPFRVIAADPPWPYDRVDDPTHRGSITYHSMSIEQICELGVEAMAHDDCVLWLWTTNSFMRQAYQVLDAWGFEEKTILTWVKKYPSIEEFERTNPDRRGYSREAHLYRNGYSTKEISDLIGISQWGIQDRLRRQGVIDSSRRVEAKAQRVCLVERQLEIIDGEMLGDGNLQRHGSDRVARLRWSLKSRQHVDLLVDEFSELLPTVRRRKDRDGWVMWTSGNATLTSQRERWYPEGEKRVPQDLVLTPLSVFHWYICDGSRAKDGSITLCTEGFPGEDVERLIDLLVKIGVGATKRKCDGGVGPRIYIGVNESGAFLDYIGHCRVPDYAHKWGDPKRVLAGAGKFGVGNYLRNQTEHCIVAVRGKPTLSLTNQTTVLEAPVREHSRKPEEFYALVESLCPGSKVEMFSREDREGWERWGSETKFAEGAQAT